MEPIGSVFTMEGQAHLWCDMRHYGCTQWCPNLVCLDLCTYCMLLGSWLMHAWVYCSNNYWCDAIYLVWQTFLPCLGISLQYKCIQCHCQPRPGTAIWLQNQSSFACHHHDKRFPPQPCPNLRRTTIPILGIIFVKWLDLERVWFRHTLDDDLCPPVGVSCKKSSMAMI